MKARFLFILCLTILAMAYPASAGTSINNSNKFAYGANVGWINWEADTDNGAWMGQMFITGFVYSANTGWINMGGGPTNGYEYGHGAADDFGINILSGGLLRGFAYGANIGWVKFESNGNPRVDLDTGKLRGFAYGANVGWISLSNDFAFVQTDQLDPGPSNDGDSIPDIWEIAQVGNTSNLMDGGDFDGDGVSDVDEYAGDTDPDDNSDVLQITDLNVFPGSVTSTVTWASQPSRLYALEKADALNNGTTWTDSGLGVQSPDSGASTTWIVGEGDITTRFFRVRAIVPLAP